MLLFKSINSLLKSSVLYTAVVLTTCLIISSSAVAQTDTLSVKKIEYVYLLHADETRYDKRINADAQILVGNVSFRHDSLYMYCDSALFYEAGNSLEAYGNIHMNQGDTLFLDGDQLFYDGNDMLARVRYNVTMKDPRMVLTTDSLNYDRTINLGYYFDWGTLKDSLNTLVSEWGEYDTHTKDAVFNYNVTLTNENFVLTSDTLGYNTETRIATINGPSNIDSDDNHIWSTLGIYDTEKDQCELLQRSVLTNEDNRLTGDSLFYDRSNGFGEAFRNVILNDYKNKCRLTGDYVYYNQLNDSAYASGRAIATDFSQGDSLFIHGDTLRMTTHYKTIVPKTIAAGDEKKRRSQYKGDTLPPSSEGKVKKLGRDLAYDLDSQNGDSAVVNVDTADLSLKNENDSAALADVALAEEMDSLMVIPLENVNREDTTSASLMTAEAVSSAIDSVVTYRLIEAFRKVRIYRTDIQAVCDSLIFNSLDSCLTMYYDPIIWNGNQQVLGEKIMVYLNDSTIKWAHIENQALMVEQLDTARFNQICGREIKAYFKDGDIDYTDVEGSVSVVYYYREEGDSLFVGMNTTEAGMLTAYMLDKQVNKLFIKGKSSGVFYPLDQIPPDKTKLPTFAWFPHVRPLSSYDILIWRGKTNEQKLKKSSRSAVPLPTIKDLQP